jgi:membrane protein DedA with SNARE-associated domain
VTDLALSLVPVYGGWVLFLGTYFSCLALPVPSSLLMLAGGAFALAGDLALLSVTGAAYVGAVAGDQTGYAIGRWGGAPMVRKMAARPKTQKTVEQAQSRLADNALVSVFLSRWLFSPLGPYVNFIAGAVQLNWLRFSVGSVAGEAVWVMIYGSLGWVFAEHLATVAGVASDVLGVLLGVLLVVLLGRAAFRRMRNGADA